jgi:hypothetical protein
MVAMSEKGPRCVVWLGDAVSVLKRIPLALIGRFVKDKQRFAITRETLTSVARNFRKRLADTVIDYEHASEHPEEAGGGPIPAAGWIKAVDDAPDANGVLWGQAEFTPRAQKMIADKEYRYFSPVIDWGARDKSTGEPQGATLTSAALTNRPFLEGLPAIAMSDAEWAKEQEQQREASRVSSPNFNPVPSYLRQPWSAVQNEIEGRVEDMLRGNKLLDWNQAWTAVTTADPGLADQVWDAVNVELNRRIRELQASNNYDPNTGAPSPRPTGRPLGYGSALDAVMRADAGFARYYRAAKEAQIGGGAELSSTGQVDAEIAPLVKEKIAASEGKMGYRDAWRAVLSERPDLALRRSAAM